MCEDFFEDEKEEEKIIENNDLNFFGFEGNIDGRKMLFSTESEYYELKGEK